MIIAQALTVDVREVRLLTEISNPVGKCLKERGDGITYLTLIINTLDLYTGDANYFKEF